MLKCKPSDNGARQREKTYLEDVSRMRLNYYCFATFFFSTFSSISAVLNKMMKIANSQKIRGVSSVFLNASIISSTEISSSISLEEVAVIARINYNSDRMTRRV